MENKNLIKEKQMQALKIVLILLDVKLKSAHELEKIYENSEKDFDRGYFYANARAVEDCIDSVKIVMRHL